MTTSPPAGRWHEYAERLALIFADVMHVELSNWGPASRFMEKIIPTISGETPPGPTVMAYVRRKQQKRREEQHS
jgi:hypothetical protein